MRKTIILTTLIALLCVTVQAQIQTPAPSPASKLTQTVGLTQVEVEYSRPGVKGREIFGGLLPYDQVWRTGANAATKISFNDKVKLGGKELPAGSYAILTKPGKKEWEVMLFNYESGSWPSYLEKDPVAQMTVSSESLNDMVESFTINVNNLRNSSATIDIKWANTMLSLPLEVYTDEKVMASISRFKENPEMSLANAYYQAGSYYFNEDKDPDQALDWVNKAIEINPNAFWMIRTQALILAEKKDYKKAIAAAEQSMKKAKEANNDDYIRLNEASIAEWKSK